MFCEEEEKWTIEYLFVYFLYWFVCTCADTIRTKQTKRAFCANVNQSICLLSLLLYNGFYFALWQWLAAVWSSIVVFKLKLCRCFDQLVCSVELCFSCVNLSCVVLSPFVGEFLFHCYLNANLKQSLLMKLIWSAFPMDNDRVCILISILIIIILITTTNYMTVGICGYVL